MVNRLVIASAGAGKSTVIVSESQNLSKNGGSILVLTYTRSNQRELLNKFCRETGCKPSSVVVKGWFSFLIEDMIRPYQSCVFTDRIQGISFNKNGNPHLRGKFHIPGRKETLEGRCNPKHYLGSEGRKAYTFFVSKLAMKVHKESKGKPVRRLAEMYDAVYIDEVQDLVGWDYEVLKVLAKNNELDLVCVGDFRQTVYSTHSAKKSPNNNTEKIQKFTELNMEPEFMDISRRCIQQICDFSERVHADLKIFNKTVSLVENIPRSFENHLGVFVVHPNDVQAYLDIYDPVILRRNRITEEELCKGSRTCNYRTSKGATYDRSLIFPTGKYRDFLKGNAAVFSRDTTDQARNTLYVIATRSRYSVAFVCDGNDFVEGVSIWKRPEA